MKYKHKTTHPADIETFRMGWVLEAVRDRKRLIQQLQEKGEDTSFLKSDMYRDGLMLIRDGAYKDPARIAEELLDGAVNLLPIERGK